MREKSTDATAGKPDGQPGRIGTTLKKIDDPDEIEVLAVDRSALPVGDYHEIGYECRQVFDIDIRRLVTEYRVQIQQDQNGQRFTAPFPAQVTNAVQYGNGFKAQAVYLSPYQLIPYQRVQKQFQVQLGLPLSTGSVFTFNQQAYAALARFEQTLIAKLLDSRVCKVTKPAYPSFRWGRLSISLAKPIGCNVSPVRSERCITQMRNEGWKPCKPSTYCHALFMPSGIQRQIARVFDGTND